MMDHLRDLPLLLFFLTLVGLWLSAQLGVFLRRKLRSVEEEERMDLATLETATLTLLGLIIAFTFSMAVSRYDLRKNYEAEEANAIGTEYARSGLLTTAEAARVRALLKEYLRQRIRFYESSDAREIQQVNTVSNELESELWANVQSVAARVPTQPIALAVSGMNDVFNNRSYTQAAWWNRIPAAGWDLMITIALLSNFMLGYGAHKNGTHLFLILPLVLSISFLLISDLDSPRGGIIRVLPQNLINLQESLASQ